MTLHSEDYAKVYMPLVSELLKALIGLIFGKKQTKQSIVSRYKGGFNNEDIDNENTNDRPIYDPDSGNFSW